MRFRPYKGLPLALFAIFAISTAWAGSGKLPRAPKLTAAEIVAGMQTHNRLQREELRDYRSLRTYQVQYRGYHAKISATMKVAVRYDAASGKHFRIVSKSGSSFLCNDVLKRAVESEEEASEEKGAASLTPANYKFRLLGSTRLNGRLAYILYVRPVKRGKFLYKGKIWVDAVDFAVVKIKAAPAKSPSFWITRTKIWHTNKLTGGYWLPQETRSQTWVRIGGKAVLTIHYGPYRILPEARTAQVTPLPAPVSAAPRADPPAAAHSDPAPR